MISAPELTKVLETFIRANLDRGSHTIILHMWTLKLTFLLRKLVSLMPRSLNCRLRYIFRQQKYSAFTGPNHAFNKSPVKEIPDCGKMMKYTVF